MEEAQAWIQLVTAIIAGILAAVLPVIVLVLRLWRVRGDAEATLEVLTGYQAHIEEKKKEPSALGKFATNLGKELGKTTQLMSVPAQRIAEDVNVVVDANKTTTTADKKRARRRAIAGGIFRALTGI